MLTSWRDWRLPRARWVWLAVYGVAGALSLVLGAGAWTALIGAVVALAVVGLLELWFRRRHPVDGGR